MLLNNLTKLIQPLPDECLMGFFYRMFEASGYIHLKDFQRELQISSGSIEPICLANEVERDFSALVKDAYKLDTDPYWTFGSGAFYKPFLGIASRHKIQNFINGNATSKASQFIVQNPNSLDMKTSTDHWKFCPLCIAADLHEHGVAYWHLSHQLPALSMCMKHNCQLVSYGTRKRSERRWLPPQRLYFDDFKKIKPVFKQSLTQKYHWFHKSSVDLLTMVDSFDFQSVFASCVDRDFVDAVNQPKRLIAVATFARYLEYIPHDYRAIANDRDYSETVAELVISSMLFGGSGKDNWPNPTLWLLLISAAERGTDRYDELVQIFRRNAVYTTAAAA